MKKSKGHGKSKATNPAGVSSLEAHHNQSGKLVTPFNKALGGLSQRVSWMDTGLIEVLWATLVRSSFEQARSLSIFREVFDNANNLLPNCEDSYVTHSVLSTMTKDRFDIWVKPLVSNPELRLALRPLTLIESLPDLHHWQRHLESPDVYIDSTNLMRAIAKCIDHQSQESTDIRWMKYVYFIIVCKRMRFALADEGRSNRMIDELRYYPNVGDQRAVRPAIRSGEIMLRTSMDDTGIAAEVPSILIDKLPQAWHENFWSECLRRTACVLPKTNDIQHEDSSFYVDQFKKLVSEISHYFFASVTNTALDARRDAIFGLIIYAATTAAGLHGIQQHANGRIVLRTIAETYITLKFLIHHNTNTMWNQFRNYGTGQSKLVFLKMVDAETIPEFISVADLEQYINEDMWQEYVDINLKSWSDRSLRKIAEEGGTKDLYDKYFDWTSGFVHAHWGAVRDTTFTTCLNPLHRYHRVPQNPRLTMPSVLPDAAKIMNLLLDILSQQYPTFKPRVKHEPRSQ